MRQLCYSAAMSLDGYIAGPGGEIDWILMDPEIDFAALYARFDTALMDRKTFEAAQAQAGGAQMPGIRSVVVSSTLKAADYPQVAIIADDLAGSVAGLKAEPGRDIWRFGGGVLFRSCSMWAWSIRCKWPSSRFCSAEAFLFFHRAPLAPRFT